MSRSTRYLLVCCLLLGALPVIAARPVQQGTQGVIDSPLPNATLRGVVTVTGRAFGSDFQFYKIEWGRGAGDSDWHLIGSTSQTPVSGGVLTQWDTTTVPDGVYALRLRVVKLDGNYAEYVVPQVVVANKRSTETPTPSPTPEETRGPTRTPGPTATLAVIQPTLALARPSPTPTPVRPISQSAIPKIPLAAWRESLCMGVVTMMAIFGVVGAAFALRRML